MRRPWKNLQVISDLTHYTSIISVDGRAIRCFAGDKLYCQLPGVADLNTIRNILAALEQKQQLLDLINRDLEHKITIYIGHEIACSHIEGCSLAVSSYSSSKGPGGRIAVLGPTRMDYPKVVSALDYCSKLMSEILS